MGLIQGILYTVPTALVGIIVLSFACGLAMLAILTVRKYVPHHRLKLHNDVAGSVYATLGVLYAVLLAFIVIIVWENFDKSHNNVRAEVNMLVDIYRCADSFSDEMKGATRALLKDYAKALVNDEWKKMARAEESEEAAACMNAMWKQFGSYAPRNETEKVFFEEAVHKLIGLGELRRSRLMDARTGIHPMLWFVLIAGGMITIIFISLFGAENLRAQIVMSILLASLIALILFTVFMLDYPFTGDVCITAEPFKAFIQMI